MDSGFASVGEALLHALDAIIDLVQLEGAADRGGVRGKQRLP